jgi:cold shock CspA family protein/ribosome-associated translation inhibitor RaiA
METQPQIDFQGMEALPSVRDAVARHIDQLESRFGRITACRVVVKGPGGHHRSGGLYEINIHLSVPNSRDVSVLRTPPKDERHADISFALNDAFKRARRQLQDRVRKLQGEVKLHEPTPAGRVARIDPSGDFGFIETVDGREIYFHRNSVLNGAFARLAPGTQVAFAEEQGEKGAQASTVRLLGKHLLP